MSRRSEWPFAAAGPNARRGDFRFRLLGRTVALFIPLVLGPAALAQRIDPRLPPAPQADKVFQEALKATLWVGVSRRDAAGQESRLRTGSIVDAKNRLALTMASAVAGEGFKISVMGAAFDGGTLDNVSQHYKKRLDEGAGITAEVVASDATKDLAIIQLAMLPAGAF
jgi:S1-C subfamily serine protease